MKVNNNNGVKMVIYDNAKETTKALNPYATKALFESVNIYGEKYPASDDYFSIIIDDLKQVRKNHIEANKKRNICFICDNLLYLPACKVVNIEIKENRKEYRAGCISISYDEIITFSEDIKIIVKDSETAFKKKSDPAGDNREEVKSIAEELQKAKEAKPLFNKNKDRYINLLEEKQKAGFDYIIFAYRVFEKTTNKIYFSNPVSREEKSKEYLHAEKVQKVLNDCVYKNNQLSIYEVLAILKKCNVSIKKAR